MLFIQDHGDVWTSLDQIQRGFHFIALRTVGLDEWLRRQNGMLEYSDSPDCMLRVVRRRAECEMTLSDGVVVVRGDPILDLHFWNERVQELSAKGDSSARQADVGRFVIGLEHRFDVEAVSSPSGVTHITLSRR